MKKIALSICVLFIVCCSPKKVEKTEDAMAVASENAKEAIKKVVTDETLAYMAKDYKKWASYWDHSTDVLRLDVTRQGFSQTRGWDKSGENLEDFFINNPEPITSTFVNSNYLIFSDDNLAWVAFDQKWTTKTGEESLAKAAITLVKKEGSWKIITYTAIQYEANGDAVDTLGRD